jgi:L-threonylcarbamoyladenylate synthase
VALALLAEVGLPLAAPSANRSTEVSPTLAAHVVASLGDRVSMVLDGGPCRCGIESTVVDVSGPAARLLRPGVISRRALDAALGALGPVLSGQAPAQGEASRSPGQQERHYAPRARLEVLGREALLERLATCLTSGAARRATKSPASGDTPGQPPIGVIAWGAAPFPPEASALGAEVLSLPADVAGYAAGLYEALRALDGRVGEILVEQPPRGDEWEAIDDRLRRAAAR